MTDTEKLRMALQRARDGLAAGNDPYGAALFNGDVLVAAEHNRVLATGDPTAHAEIETIRAAARTATADVLAASVLYTSCEPCPMCIGAIRWVGIRAVVYAARDDDYGDVDSRAPKVAHPAARHLPLDDADALLQTAKGRWENR